MAFNAENSQRLNLPFILPSQAQKHVTHNEALARLDATVHAAVVSRTAEAPALPVEDACHVVPEGAIGAWLGKDNDLATWNGAVWQFLSPPAGYLAYVQDEDRFSYFDGDVWQNLKSGDLEPQISALGINAPIDALARLSVCSPGVLFSHDPEATDPANLRLTLNKQAPASTASAMFQTNWSGRAEMGLCGNDNLAIKVSPDGTSWKTALEAKAASGQLRAPEGLSVGEESGMSGRTLTIASSIEPRMVMKSNGAVGNAHKAFISWVDGNGEEKVWCGLGSSVNSTFSFLTHYSGGLSFISYGGNHPIEFRQGNDGNQVRMRIHTNGYIGINALAPTTPLHVGGAIRVGSSTVAGLPSPVTSGAGAIIYVSDEAGGATLAFSDGTNWRKIHDRAVI